MNQTVGGVPVWLLTILVIVLFLQGTWLFTDARKRQAAPWFWGIWGLIQFPMPLLLYWLFVRSDWRNHSKDHSIEEEEKEDDNHA